ncbi:hTAFII28-like protein conserved region-domain-containing protein [Lophiotrema nucula]|uniref:HTAFII28-like protein conserved region-domain-containing protein n=1 Tax=Lophiotrema nucula TaxID=690887 RepID=A0A6A5Z632_9PLEO|nr:hTAFII28-like protein conserved region-domain-containing protein [Lophiotrema nucula]
MASPPHIPSISIPRKRSSISSVTSAAKKRKPSALRNAFSPEASDLPGSPLRYSRSPSVDSVATGSMANGVAGKKRKRKDVDAQSATGSARAGTEGPSGARDARSQTGAAQPGDADQDAEDYDYDDDDMGAELQGGNDAAASREAWKESERILMDFMSPDQTERYEKYRRIRLKREILRRLVNQTLSQSVPQPVIIAVTTYSKAFIGEIIDRALTVRDEWTAAATHRPNPDIPTQLLQVGMSAPKGFKKDAKPTDRDYGTAQTHPDAVGRDKGYWKEVPNDTPLEERLKHEDKGPLTPAHLREALRRYKRDREGGGAGFGGLSLEGPERSLGKTGGRRLFR